MVTISEAGLAALARLGELRPGPAQVNAIRAAKAARRAARWDTFHRSIGDGLRYSRAVSRSLVKAKGDGGAVPEWRLRRIIP